MSLNSVVDFSGSINVTEVDKMSNIQENPGRFQHPGTFTFSTIERRDMEMCSVGESVELALNALTAIFPALSAYFNNF